MPRPALPPSRPGPQPPGDRRRGGLLEQEQRPGQEQPAAAERCAACAPCKACVLTCPPFPAHPPACLPSSLSSECAVRRLGGGHRAGLFCEPRDRLDFLRRHAYLVSARALVLGLPSCARQPAPPAGTMEAPQAACLPACGPTSLSAGQTIGIRVSISIFPGSSRTWTPPAQWARRAGHCCIPWLPQLLHGLAARPSARPRLTLTPPLPHAPPHRSPLMPAAPCDRRVWKECVRPSG